MAQKDESSSAPLADIVKCVLAEHAKNPVVPKIWLDPREAGTYLGVHEVTLANWRRQKRGPRWHRINRKFIRYRISDLDCWIDPNAAAGGTYSPQSARPPP